MNPSLLLDTLYEFVVVGKEKAIGGAAVAAVVAFAAQHLGYHVSSGLQQLVLAAVVGLLTHATVYFTTNREL